jgi:hypothetical protein
VDAAGRQPGGLRTGQVRGQHKLLAAPTVCFHAAAAYALPCRVR